MTSISVDPSNDQLSRAADYRARGYWDDGFLTDYVDRWAEEDPDHPYLSDGTSRLSYGEFRQQARSLAASLRGLGVRPGDRVAVQLPNWNEYFLVYAACSSLAAVMIPVVGVYRESEVRYIVESSGAVGLVTPGAFRGFDHAAMAADVGRAVPSLAFRVVVRGEATQGAVSFADLVAAPVEDGWDPGRRASADDPHLILFSSGTEARPKACLHTWSTSSFLPKQAVAALGMGRDDVMFMPAPVTHALGMTLGVMAPTIAGAAVELIDVFEPTAALEQITRGGCTGTASPAPFIRLLLDAYDPAVHDMSRLRFWLSAGAPIPKTLVEEAAATIPGCRVVSAYGSSEVMMATVCRPGDSVDRVASSDGAPVDGVELRIVDQDENEAAVGVEGEIRYRGPGRILEYLGRPDLTAAALDADGWWRTGDLGRMDDEGYLRVTGRLKDIIIRGGFNISAREVEEALLEHPAVANVAVVGLPDERLGERACAVVVPRGDQRVTLAELRTFLADKRKIATWKVPERIEFVDGFPLTATGKVQKFALRDRYRGVADGGTS
ncbi:MAG: o-succinylbenzoate--CoA ligase [Nocardioides sp.]|nr:o-succinylbenzoate--CoA ligase [Nocardioides sp.]